MMFHDAIEDTHQGKPNLVDLGGRILTVGLFRHSDQLTHIPWAGSIVQGLNGPEEAKVTDVEVW